MSVSRLETRRNRVPCAPLILMYNLPALHRCGKSDQGWWDSPSMLSAPNWLLLCSGSGEQWGETATDIQLSAGIKTKYSEIVPVLSGRGDKAFITLLGRRRDNPERLEKITSRPWKEGEPVNIVWEDVGATSTG